MPNYNPYMGNSGLQLYDENTGQYYDPSQNPDPGYQLPAGIQTAAAPGSYDPNAGTDTSNGAPPPATTLGRVINPYDTDDPANRGSGGTYNQPEPGNDANQINGWVSGYLGRDASPMEVTGWLNSGKSLGEIQNAIANSSEAQNFAKTGGKPQQQSGSNGLADAMSALTNSPLLQPWTVPFSYAPWESPKYKEPTTEDFYKNDPGLQARLNLGQKAIERSAAAKGTLLNAGTVQAENEFAQDYGSNEYNNYFNRNLTNFQTLYNSGLTDWTTNYNKALQEYQQAYNIFSNNQNNAFNKLAAVSGAGQTSAAQLGSAGLGYAQLNTNTNMTGATNLGNLFGQGANATAAGLVGSANAWNGALSNISNMANLYATSYGKK